MQKNKVGPLLLPECKVNPKGIRALDVRNTITKLLGRNVNVSPHDLGFGHDVFDLLSKAQATKGQTDEPDPHRLSCCARKGGGGRNGPPAETAQHVCESRA